MSMSMSVSVSVGVSACTIKTSHNIKIVNLAVKKGHTSHVPGYSSGMGKMKGCTASPGAKSPRKLISTASDWLRCGV